MEHGSMTPAAPNEVDARALATASRHLKSRMPPRGGASAPRSRPGKTALIVSISARKAALDACAWSRRDEVAHVTHSIRIPLEISR